jgi:alcohol dehydrogenase class IV
MAIIYGEALRNLYTSELFSSSFLRIHFIFSYLCRLQSRFANGFVLENEPDFGGVLMPNDREFGGFRPPRQCHWHAFVPDKRRDACSTSHWTNGRDARFTCNVNFEFATAARVVFGAGKLKEVGALARPLGMRALVVIGKSAGAVQRVEPMLSALTESGIEYATFSVVGEPTLEVVRMGTQRARDEHCDFVIGFGGGSVMDTGKAIAVLFTNGGDPLDYLEVIGKGQPLTKPSAPYMAIPTTAGTGSEVTRNAVLGSPEQRAKVSMRSPFILPPQLTATTGMDALTQLIEAFVSVKANPLTDAICREGMMRAARSLRYAYEHPSSQEIRPASRQKIEGARQDMCVASVFGGMALANAGLGAVHGLSSPLGGMFDAPHGALCAVLLPHVMEVNRGMIRGPAGRGAVSAPTEIVRRFEEVAQIVGDLGELVRALKISPLRQYGVKREDFPEIIEKAKLSNSMKGNPLPLRDEELREILERAL